MTTWCLDCQAAGSTCDTCSLARVVAIMEQHCGPVAIEAYPTILRAVQQARRYFARCRARLGMLRGRKGQRSGASSTSALVADALAAQTGASVGGDV